MPVSRAVRRIGVRLFVGGLAALTVSACASSTQLQSSWVKPDTGPLNFRKIVAIAITKDPARRRAMEETMTSELKRAEPDVVAVPSYTLINDNDMNKEGRVREEVNRAGFDGAIFMRVTDVSRQDVYVPGQTTYAPTYYRSFWGYYHYWAPIAYEPGYIERDTNVQVETEVYSTAGDGELVYSAVSRTLNPSSSSDLVADVASVVTHDMKAKGLIRHATAGEQ
jgi:hypothetical protein